MSNASECDRSNLSFGGQDFLKSIALNGLYIPQASLVSSLISCQKPPLSIHLTTFGTGGGGSSLQLEAFHTQNVFSNFYSTAE